MSDTTDTIAAVTDELIDQKDIQPIAVDGTALKVDVPSLIEAIPVGEAAPLPPPPMPQMTEQGLKIEISIAELQKKKLLVCAPMYGGMATGPFTQSMMALSKVCHEFGVQMTTFFLFNESLITRARNYCSDTFLRSDATHMLFIDADIGFNPHDVIALLALQDDRSPFDVIGAPYPKKCIAWEKIKMAVDKGFADENPENLQNFVGDYVFNPKNNGNIPLNQPVEVLEIGTGFMMIRRSAFKGFDDKFPQYKFRPDHVRTKDFDGSREIMMYFQAEIDQLDFGHYYEAEMKRLASKEAISASDLQDIITKAHELNSKKSKRYLSEDYWFCQRLQDAGMKVWLCPWMRLQHFGTMTFGGSLIDLAALGAHATADPSQLKKK